MISILIFYKNKSQYEEDIETIRTNYSGNPYI